MNPPPSGKEDSYPLIAGFEVPLCSALRSEAYRSKKGGVRQLTEGIFYQLNPKYAIENLFRATIAAKYTSSNFIWLSQHKADTTNIPSTDVEKYFPGKINVDTCNFCVISEILIRITSFAGQAAGMIFGGKA